MDVAFKIAIRQATEPHGSRFVKAKKGKMHNLERIMRNGSEWSLKGGGVIEFGQARKRRKNMATAGWGPTQKDHTRGRNQGGYKRCHTVRTRGVSRVGRIQSGKESAH